MQAHRCCMTVCEGLDHTLLLLLQVAIKSFSETVLGKQGLRELAMLEHMTSAGATFAIRCFGTAVQIGTMAPAAVMELGRPLATEYRLDVLLKSRKMARRFCFQILVYLAELHANGIVHGDIKLENIVVTGKGDEMKVKVVDLGIAKLLQQFLAGSAPTAVYTVGYAPPEQIYLNLSITVREQAPKMDIWAFGVVVLALFSGHRDPLHLLHCNEPDAQYSRFDAIEKWGMMYHMKRTGAPKKVKAAASALGDSGLEVLCAAVTFAFQNRPDAEELLKKDWFEEDRKHLAKKVKQGQAGAYGSTLCQLVQSWEVA